MFYRVQMTLAFTSEDEAKDFYHDGELALPKSHNINPGTPAQEISRIILQKCYHDEDPLNPCDLIKHAQKD